MNGENEIQNPFLAVYSNCTVLHGKMFRYKSEKEKPTNEIKQKKN